MSPTGRSPDTLRRDNAPAPRGRSGRATVRDLGPTGYDDTWNAMKRFTAERTPSTVDELWLTEHPPVFTVGIAGRPEHLPLDGDGIPLVRTDRGGQVTYHGPGQIVLYTLLDLRRLDLTIRTLVRRLEDSVVGLLASHGVDAAGDPARPGVYVGGAKIAALGLKIRGGCSYHGLAFNVDMDLAPFGRIDPCGFPGLDVTDARRLGITAPREELAASLAQHLMERLYG
ncbi:MAG: lipoyl(octanoyl) transferase LipB [Betaproteobacteria bacterium]|nr:lipoyl(octanoyl) transferase LipB [Betaproteobacteria bacterium]